MRAADLGGPRATWACISLHSIRVVLTDLKALGFMNKRHTSIKARTLRGNSRIGFWNRYTRSLHESPKASCVPVSLNVALSMPLVTLLCRGIGAET